MKMKETKNTKSDVFLRMPITGVAVIFRSWLLASTTCNFCSVTASISYYLVLPFHIDCFYPIQLLQLLSLPLLLMLMLT